VEELTPVSLAEVLESTPTSPAKVGVEKMPVSTSPPEAGVENTSVSAQDIILGSHVCAEAGIVRIVYITRAKGKEARQAKRLGAKVLELIAMNISPVCN
jgi:hypothetical protein